LPYKEKKIYLIHDSLLERPNTMLPASDKDQLAALQHGGEEEGETNMHKETIRGGEWSFFHSPLI
jgi:hypothetical protein